MRSNTQGPKATLKRMLVSVILPFHTELQLIGRAVRSVVSQSPFVYGELGLEVIVVNDGPCSCDAILNSIPVQDRDPVRVIRNEGNHGPGGARNAGLHFAQGDVFAFLDADDYWLEGKIRRQIDSVKAGFTFVATGYTIGNRHSITPPSAVEDPIDVFRKGGIGTSTVMVHTSVVGSLRFRDLRFAQDIDYWYLLARQPHFRFASVSEPFVVYSRAGSTKNKLTQFRAFRRVLELNQVPFAERVRILASYACRGVWNHYIAAR